MKKTLLLLASVLAFSNYVEGQNLKPIQGTKKFGKKIQVSDQEKTNGFVRCYTNENEAALKAKYSNRATQTEFEAWLAPKVAKIKSDRLAGRNIQQVYNIPVVIHIIHNGDAIGTGENITDAQAISQIQVLNEDFRRMAGTNGGANTTGLAVDCEINFCLAQTDPNGNLTSGVVRHNIAPYTNAVADGSGGADWETRADVESMKQATYWNPDQYLNFWVIRPGGNSINALFNPGLDGLLGYAQFPSNSGLAGLNTNGGLAATDGLVCAFYAMGTIEANDGTFILDSTYNLGRTMTHEAGHWLGLRHIWGDPGNGVDGCSVDDYCADTPNAKQPNTSCNLAANTCPLSAGNDMVQNYMDYTNDACMDTFTQDQKDRIMAVMANSPRRGVLNSSLACQTPTPLIRFTSPTGSINEGTGCDYTDYTYAVTIGKPATADAIVTFNVTGTATQGEDYTILTNPITFTAGSTATQNLTIRVYHDGKIEGDETIQIQLNLSTSGDAVLDAGASTKTITIVDNDTAPSASFASQIFYDSFESYNDFTVGGVGGWTALDLDGDNTYGFTSISFTNENYIGSYIVFNPSGTTPSTTGGGLDPHTGSKGYYCFNSTGNISGTALNNDWAITPQVSLGINSELVFWAKSNTNNYTGGERFNVLVSTTDTNMASFTKISVNPYTVPPTSWTEYSYDLSAYDGQNVYIAIQCVSADEFIFMLDDVSITSDMAVQVQTAVNVASPKQIQLNGIGATPFYDVTNTNIVSSINVTSTTDFGCTSAAVSSAGTSAVQYGASANTADFRMSKQFTITPANVVAGNTTITFYFTEAEIAGWEAATGNSRSQLYVQRVGSTTEAKSVTVGAFGSNVTLTASFANGIDGVYSFARQQYLVADDFNMSDLVVYPNPNNGTFNIQMNVLEEKTFVKVFDIRGRILVNKVITSSGLINESINLQDAQSGIYLISIENGARKTTRRIIVE